MGMDVSEMEDILRPFRLGIVSTGLKDTSRHGFPTVKCGANKSGAYSARETLILLLRAGH
jgi:hypothetical protein